MKAWPNLTRYYLNCLVTETRSDTIALNLAVLSHGQVLTTKNSTHYPPPPPPPPPPPGVRRKAGGCTIVSPLSRISGLSVMPLSQLLFFCLVLLIFLSCHFSVNGPFSGLFFPESSQFLLLLRVRLFLFGSC